MNAHNSKIPFASINPHLERVCKNTPAILSQALVWRTGERCTLRVPLLAWLDYQPVPWVFAELPRQQWKVAAGFWVIGLLVHGLVADSAGCARVVQAHSLELPY